MRSPPRILTLILLTGLSTVSLNMFVPALPAIAAELGTSYATVSLAIAGYLAVMAVTQMVMGPLSDRFGRRPVMLGALACYVVAASGVALSGSAGAFLGWRMPMAAITAGWVVTLAVVRDTAAPGKAAAIMGTISGAMALAPLLGPLIGGVVAQVLGWRAIFALYAVAGALMLALCWRDFGETRKPAPREPLRASARRLLGDGGFWAFAGCTALSTACFYGYIAGFPAVSEARYGLGEAATGAALGAITGGFMCGAFISARLAERAGLTRMMLAGRLCAAGGLAGGLIWALAIGPLSAPGLVASVMFVGLGNGLTMPSSNAGAIAAVEGLAGSASGLLGALTVALGAVVTAGVAALVATRPTPAMLLATLLALALAALGAAVIAHRRG
ncbi:MAG: MFS transporter [Vannielia sp.]|uniref:MFS transporter n=1 Tax=Vannielia sp. TaxID=2813045 RepID=UPI003B8DEFBE